MSTFDLLWPYPQDIEIRGQFGAPHVVRLEGNVLPHAYADDLRQVARAALSEGADAYPVALSIDPALSRRQEYTVEVGESRAVVTGADAAGLDHGWQTLLQLLALFQKQGRGSQLFIRDWPAYRKRSFMADMGRSAFSLPMLKRIVRILRRLKMNQLHLHLYDDELCGLRFHGLPFGRENPYAITLSELKELVDYAAAHHVEIVPELEGWGHVGSLVYHRPELRGGEGMYNGSSFLVGEGALALMEELARQVAEALPDRGILHLGLDEAKWFLAPGMPDGFTPTHLVGRYGEMVAGLESELGKSLTMRIWADHGGRPVPKEIQPRVIIEPWQYWNGNRAAIAKAIARYSGPDKMRWMAGAGQSVAQYRGAYHASRHWCRGAAASPNIEGINLTFWGCNNLADNLISLFAGASYAWNPFPDTDWANVDEYEHFDRLVFPIMHAWQSLFRDAFDDDLRRDQGPTIRMGYYQWGERHGRPAAPTAPLASTWPGHDFINEG